MKHTAKAEAPLIYNIQCDNSVEKTRQSENYNITSLNLKLDEQKSTFCWSFDLLFILIRVALWPSAGKELSPWLFTCVVFISVPS